MKKVLLLGSGYDTKPKINHQLSTSHTEKCDVVRLDINKAVNPDVLHDLNDINLPFQDNSFDEIHAYEVLEHVGQQGDWKTFFAQFTEFHRILKLGGHMVFSCPKPDSKWAWGDPGHTRLISPQMIAFLDQAHYGQCQKGSPCTDYRPWYKVNFTNIKYIQIPKTDSYFYSMKAE